ncbi:MAG: hypothetical protein ACK4WC_17315, partial [Rubrimonas sp.]
PSDAAALDQAVRALAMGCVVVVCAPGATAATAALRVAGLPVAALEAGPPRTLDARGFDALGWEGPRAGLRRMLAARNGPLVPIIAADDPVEAWAVERVVSIDLTAAGGDAALLARAG